MHAIYTYTKNSVQMIGWSTDPMCICMEKYDMSLADVLFGSRKMKVHGFALGIKDVFKAARDICEALVVCEDLKIIHNDLKPGKMTSIQIFIHELF